MLKSDSVLSVRLPFATARKFACFVILSNLSSVVTLPSIVKSGMSRSKMTWKSVGPKGMTVEFTSILPLVLALSETLLVGK